MKGAASLLGLAYRHFAAVAEAGSVRAASRQLNVAPSAISRQIGLLEAELGLPLFDRSGRSLELSQAGEVLLRGLRAVEQGHQDVADELDALKGLKRGLVRVATVESISGSVLPDVLRDFLKRFPGIQVSVIVAGSDAVTELVREHHADIGFTFNPKSLSGLEVEARLDMQLGAIMAPSHPLARHRRLTLADCFGHPLAWPARGLSLRAILDRAMPAKGAVLKPAFECNSLRVMASLARNGSCVAFQTPIGIERELGDGSLVFIPLTGKALGADRLVVVRRPGLSVRHAPLAFLELARAYLPSGKVVRKMRT